MVGAFAWTEILPPSLLTRRMFKVVTLRGKMPEDGNRVTKTGIAIGTKLKMQKRGVRTTIRYGSSVPAFPRRAF